MKYFDAEWHPDHSFSKVLGPFSSHLEAKRSQDGGQEPQRAAQELPGAPNSRSKESNRLREGLKRPQNRARGVFFDVVFELAGG